MPGMIIFAHVLTGTLALLAGAVAVGGPKGRSVHVTAGRFFVALMTLSSILGALLGLIRFDQFFITFFAGLLGAYLVLSGWLAARMRTPEHGPAGWILGLINVANCAALLVLGSIALSAEDGKIFGFAGGNYLFLAGICGIAAVGDISLIVRSRLAAPHAIARHLWRMLMGFFIAAGSAFTGPGAKAFPEWIQQSGILSVPELLILLLLLFYLVRTLLFKRKGRQVRNPLTGVG